MSSSGMLCRVPLVRTDVSEERIASIIRVTRICDIGTMLAVTSNRRAHIVFLLFVIRFLVTANVVPISQNHVTLMMEVKQSSETSVLTRGTPRNIPEDGIFQ
jgi:hypothetical protein